MDNMEKGQSVNGLQVENTEDRNDQSDCGDCSCDSMADVDATSSVRTSTVTKRSSGIVVEDEVEDEDIMLQQNWREDNVLQWIQALDVQVMGACRSDERLKPLLKLNAFTGAAEDRLLMHLSQNFEPSEVGMLARCLCAPLVSLRVGKINRQGKLLIPTSTRGNVNVTLLPTSALRISFIGDDGFTERLATLHTDTQCSAVEIEELEADRSGRSFGLRIPDHEILYFWCSEKYVLSGIELLCKMRDLLKCKPSLSEVTGISKSRLDAFAVHLRAYLVGSTLTNARASNALSSNPPISTSVESIGFGPNGPNVNVQSSVVPLKPSGFRHNSNLGTKSSTHYQGSLSPRSSSFKDNATRNSSLKSVSRDKFRRRGESYMSCADNISITSPSLSNVSSLYGSDDKFPEAAATMLFPTASSFLEKPGTDASLSSPAVQIPSAALPLLSPYYCWCPPASSTAQHAATTLPPPALLYNSDSLLSSLLSNNLPSGLSKLKSPLNLDQVVSTSNLPSFLPDPFVRFPLSLQTGQQIPTFTPLMCDSIVHIPVMDVCSSGQGYLVSAGPALSTAIAPVHPNMVGPLMPETNSAVEKSARETLRLLISRSNESNPPLMDLLPPVLTIRDEKQNILAVGSRGLYMGTRDVSATARSIAAVGLTSPSMTFEGCGEMKRCTNRENTVNGCGSNYDPPSDGSCGSISGHGFSDMDGSCGSISGHGFSDIGERRTS